MSLRSALREYKDSLQKVARGKLDEAGDDERRQAVQHVIQTASVAAAAVALQPLPFVDPLLLTPIHIGMVQAIARAYGHRLDRKSALEKLRAVSSSLLTQNVAITGAKFVPTLGWLYAASVAHALTFAVGDMTDRYFRGGRNMLPAEMRKMLRQIYSETLERTVRQKHRPGTCQGSGGASG
jgi:uncharacterized protein (DUF697 family)